MELGNLMENISLVTVFKHGKEKVIYLKEATRIQIRQTHVLDRYYYDLEYYSGDELIGYRTFDSLSEAEAYCNEKTRQWQEAKRSAAPERMATKVSMYLRDETNRNDEKIALIEALKKMIKEAETHIARDELGR